MHNFSTYVEWQCQVREGPKTLEMAHLCLAVEIRKGAVQYEQGSIGRGFLNGGGDERARFLKVAVQKIPAAQKEFSELYGEELL